MPKYVDGDEKSEARRGQVTGRPYYRIRTAITSLDRSCSSPRRSSCRRHTPDTLAIHSGDHTDEIDERRMQADERRRLRSRTLRSYAHRASKWSSFTRYIDSGVVGTRETRLCARKPPRNAKKHSPWTVRIESGESGRLTAEPSYPHSRRRVEQASGVMPASPRFPGKGLSVARRRQQQQHGRATVYIPMVNETSVAIICRNITLRRNIIRGEPVETQARLTS